MSLIYLVLVAVIHIGNGARILGIVPTPSYSHQVVFQPLWRELSLRGHQVTTLTTDPINDSKLTNLTEIDLHFSYGTWHKNIMDSVFSHNDNTAAFMVKIMQQYVDTYEEQLNHPGVQALINGDDKFDVVIIEAVAPPMVAFVEKYKCPMIGMISMDGPNFLYKMMGNPTHLSIYPDIFDGYDEHLSFLQRLKSFTTTYAIELFGFFINRKINSLVKKYFGQNYTAVESVMDNTSLLFVNSDPIFHPVRPLVPSVIQIGGGSHLKPPKPLPADLKSILDSAKNGFIYFSLGSNVKSKDIPDELRSKILETFAELPYIVLWKFEADTLPNNPNNVFIRKWLPQQDVLRHPNIKLFITQGGLQSIDEATYSGVPMIVIPFFGDQAHNSKRIENKGMGLSMDYNNFEKYEFKTKILEIINSSKYQNQIKKLAKLAEDQPMTGLERAVWWTEYVIRHKGAKHLRSPLKDIPWYQYLLLDVIGALLFSFVAIIYTVYKLICLVLRWSLKSELKDKKN